MKAAIILVLAAVACRAESNAKVSVTRWPDDRGAAVSLTFDDAMNTHLDIARPILKKHHLNGTFFVATGRDVWVNRVSEWQALAAEGNEIASHTVHHPCLLDIITPHSQDYTPEMMRAEIRDSAQEINTRIKPNRGLTFAYPCGNVSFGPASDQARNAGLYLDYIASECFAARIYGFGGGPQDPDALSALTVTDLGITDKKDYLALLEMAAPALRQHQWGVFAFHGIGGEWLAVSKEDFEELAAFLERHPEIWTATFGDAARYTQERRSLKIQTAGDDRRMTLNLTWPLDPKTYDLPLTLRVELPGGWTAASVQTDGKPVASRLSQPNILLVNVPPGAKSLILDRQ